MENYVTFQYLTSENLYIFFTKAHIPVNNNANRKGLFQCEWR